MKALNLPESFHTRRLTYLHQDDFHAIDAGYTTAGTVAAQDSPDGEVKLTTGTTANNEALVRLTKKTLKFAPGIPIVFGARVKHVDASPDTSAIAVGFADQAGAALIADGGLALKGGGVYGALFVKFKGEAHWRCITSAGSAGTTVQNAALNVNDRNNLSRKTKSPGAAYQELEIEVLPVYGAIEVVYRIDGEVVAKHQSVDITNAAAMAPVLFVKTTTTDAQVLSADRWEWAQARS